MTQVIEHLPKEAAEIASEQGWDAEAMVIHMIGFLRDNVPMYEKKLELYFGAMADEENGDMERLT